MAQPAPVETLRSLDHEKNLPTPYHPYTLHTRWKLPSGSHIVCPSVASGAPLDPFVEGGCSDRGILGKERESLPVVDVSEDNIGVDSWGVARCSGDVRGIEYCSG